MQFAMRSTVTLVATAILLSAGARAQADETMEAHDGSPGVWLKSPAVEAFVALQPKFRLLAIRRPGRESLLADSTVVHQGVRLAFMESQQVKTSFDPGDRPGELLERTPTSAKIRLAPAAGLRYDVTLRLDEAAPVVHLETTLTNLGEAPRRVGAWTVLSFARGHGGVILAPFAKEPKSRRRIVLPWWTRWPQPTVQFGRDVAVADTTGETLGAYKVGIISDAGWIAYQRGNEAIVLTAPFDATAEYPEDGANLTLFQNQSAAPWCEIEQMAPLKTIAPGEATMPYAQTIRLITLDPNTPPPTTQPGQAEVDRLRLSLAAAMQADAAVANPTSRPTN